MQTNVLLPQVELTMEQVLVAKWLVRAGDKVSAEQPLLEVETQKATSEVPSPAAGFVRKLCVKEGESIGEKALLCILTETAEETFETPAATSPSPGTPGEGRREGSVAPVESVDGPIKASPAARKLAKDLGVDLVKVRGTGPGGRITDDDVRAAKSGKGSPPPAADDDWVALPATRVALISQMHKSLAEIPQIHLSRQMDVTALSVKAEGITFTHRLIAAIGRALAQHPTLRTVLSQNKTKVMPVSVAIAMDTPHGLVAPVVRDADKLSVQEIAKRVADLRSRGEANSLRREELTDAPFAVSNLGMIGVDFFNAFVFHGQTAVLSVGRATDSSDGKKLAWFGLALDHRIVDGAEGARFLQTLQTEISRR